MLDQIPPANLPEAPCVAIVGATGAVGVELLNSLEARGFPLSNLKLLASARSA
ncbi:MAG: aspartate-semialdehyde dehydrogenase, partial [Planctomycetales bacterium]|nr:aspartate-semialdehyde dehydrogenase [Planctomycetales bacterium]NIP68865.1 aspartate-semialdehyde dehydrogenase [Planctomycetales bacterium]